MSSQLGLPSGKEQWAMLQREGNASEKGLLLTGTVSLCFLSGSRSSKTFKPKKNIPEGSHQYELLKHAEATLGSGNLRQAVMLPEGEDLNEWIAVNSKSWETEIHQCVEVEWKDTDLCFSSLKEANRKSPELKFLFQLYSL